MLLRSLKVGMWAGWILSAFSNSAAAFSIGSSCSAYAMPERAAEEKSPGWLDRGFPLADGLGGALPVIEQAGRR